MTTITVATYNIQHGMGLDMRTEIRRAADVLAEIDADVIGLQEVVFAPADARRDQAQYLASRLGMELVAGVTRPHRGNGFGNAVLTRLPVRSVARSDLTVGRREPRGCVRADLSGGDGSLSVYATHFGLGPGERRLQLDRLRTFLRAPHPGHRIVMGDFNEPHRGPITRTLWRELTHAEPPRVRSHPALFPLLALDRIYWDAELLGDGPHPHRTRLSRLASDHLPLVARLGLPPGPAAERPADAVA